MAWTNDKPELKSFTSNAINEIELAKDFLILFSQIQDDHFSDSFQLLIYIDATNGNLFISGFNETTQEVFDSNGIFVELTELWENNQNAYDFDEIVIRTLRKLFGMDDLKVFKTKFELYFQTEDENVPHKL